MAAITSAGYRKKENLRKKHCHFHSALQAAQSGTPFHRLSSAALLKIRAEQCLTQANYYQSYGGGESDNTTETILAGFFPSSTLPVYTDFVPKLIFPIGT